VSFHSLSTEALDMVSPNESMGPNTAADCPMTPNEHVGEVRLKRAVTVDDSIGYFAAQGERDREGLRG
jgi:hypothetical protein